MNARAPSTAWVLVGAILACPAPALAQAVMGTLDEGEQGVIFPTPAVGLPTPAETIITGLPAGSTPNGVAFYGADNVMLSNFQGNSVFLARISTAAWLDTIDTSAYGVFGGSIAVDPSASYALFNGTTPTLVVIHAPFSASSVITSVTLPGGLSGGISSGQTQAISFNSSGRAFIYASTGISVLDPPYTSVAFTIPVSGGGGGALAISPDGNTLLVTDPQNSDSVRIFSAPFSSSSTPASLNVGAVTDRLDGIVVLPDGSKALVVGAFSPKLWAISAPFSASAAVEQIPLPTATFPATDPGFEDIGISPDSQLAILTGGSTTGHQLPAAFVQAPFTAAGATVSSVTVGSGAQAGRGTGSVRFLPAALPATIPTFSSWGFFVLQASLAALGWRALSRLRRA